MRERRRETLLVSFVVNLNSLRRTPELGMKGQRPIVLTDSRAFAYYVRALARVGIIPVFEVVVLRGETVNAWSASAARVVPPARYIVGQDVYVRFHAAFAAAGLASRMTVL
jgi:hypothetical protein